MCVPRLMWRSSYLSLRPTVKSLIFRSFLPMVASHKLFGIAILDLYRGSRPTANDFLRILEHLQDRIWLPYQVASEFLNRREEVIDSEASSFQKALAAIKQWKDDQCSFNRLQGLLRDAGRIVSAEVACLFEKQEAYLSAVNEVERCFREKIEELANAHSLLDSDEDNILEKLILLFDNKVGNPYDEATLKKLYEEGEVRYSQKIPPGFEDAKEKVDERKYGDFVLWKQILDFAVAESRPVILVTGERKVDWWIKKNGETISPRIELRREFQERVKQPFWMYRTQRFFEIAREKLDIEIHPQSIEETNVIANAESIDEEMQEEVGADNQPDNMYLRDEDYRRLISEAYKLSKLDNAVLRLFEPSDLNSPTNSALQALEQLRLASPTNSALQALEQLRLASPTNSALQALEQLRLASPTNSALQALEQLRLASSTNSALQALEQLRLASSTNSALQALEQLRPTILNNRSTQARQEPQNDPSNFVDQEKMREEIDLEALEKKDPHVIDKIENHNEDTSSVNNKFQNGIKEKKSTYRKRSHSRKRNNSNPEK